MSQLLELILSRRSDARLSEPGPTDEQLELLLQAAITVPDHGAMRPWRFVVVRGEAHEHFADALVDAATRARPDAPPELVAKVRDKAFAAPVQIVLIARLRPEAKVEVWEQLASASCTGYAITLAAHAISNVSRSFEPGFAVRRTMHAEAKQRIGQAAAALVRDGENVVFDAGTTTLQVAEALRPDVRIRAMALSLRIADVLADQANVTLMIPGGSVRPFERSLIGPRTIGTFDDLAFDALFLTSGGIDAAAGVTEYEYDDAHTKRAALSSAKRTILVADASKLGAVAFVRVCGVEAIDVVVTDEGAPAERVDELRSAGVEVVLA